MTNNLTSKLDFESLEDASGALRSFAHPVRLAILLLLHDKSSLSVTEIYEELNLEQAVASYHLNHMKSKGVLKSKRDGNKTYYSLKQNELEKVVSYVENVYG